MNGFASGIALRARYIFPVEQPPLSNTVITVDHGCVSAVGENLSGRRPVDCGNVAILPAFVNAHTHLEFSDRTQPLGSPGIPFTEWIRQVIAWRGSQAPDRIDPDDSHIKLEVIRRGLRESALGGATLLGEIATNQWPPTKTFRPLLTDITVFAELIGLSLENSPRLLELARGHVQRAGISPSTWCAGISPHAPYTVHRDLVAAVARYSSEARVPLAMHLAESLDELELLQTHGGPFPDLLAELKAWDSTAIPLGSRPMDYLQRLALARRALVIHGNYLNEDEIQFLAEHADRMSLVYCPRTHAYFRHADYPLSHLLSVGVHVALGTDSRVSNPDLHMLNELRFVARRHPDVAPDVILRLGTLDGARALGRDQELGSLQVGKQADLIAVGLPDSPNASSTASGSKDPHELLWNSDEPVQAVMSRGTWIKPLESNE